MKRLSISMAITAIFLFFIVSCYYDNEEALYPSLSNTCDTTNVTYSGTVVSILSNNCYSCHSNKNAASYGNNIRLENYADVVANNVNISESIKQTGSISSMPKNGGKLRSCYITQFDIWVRKGMLNN
jgi:hypothetical protein